MIQIDGSSLTIYNFDARRRTRGDMVFASSPCLIYVLNGYDDQSFKYQVEVAQAIKNHLVVTLLDSSEAELLPLSSSRLFASPFLIAQSKNEVMLGLSIAFIIELRPQYFLLNNVFGIGHFQEYIFILWEWSSQVGPAVSNPWLPFGS